MLIAIFRRFIKQKPIETIVLCILSLVLLNTLFIAPIVGKANNGDFIRLYIFGGLRDLGGDNYDKVYDGFVHGTYDIYFPSMFLPWGPNWISGAIVVKISVFISFIFNIFTGHPFSFDIRFQTALYCIIFLTAVYLILKNIKPLVVKGVAGMFIILFFTDVNYIAYFNSFFGEAGVIVFLLLTLGTFMNLIHKTSPKDIDFVIFFAASAAFLTSKTQQIPLIIFMLLIYGAMYKYYHTFRKIIIVCSASVIILCAAAYISIGPVTNKNNMYQAVFAGVLSNSPNVEKDLEELGLDKKFAPLAGTGFYAKNIPFDPSGDEMKMDFYPKASRGKIMLFYMKHLDRLWEQISISAEHGYDFYNLGEGNFLKGQFSESKTVNQFRTNLVLQYPYLHKNPYIFIGFSALFFMALLYYFLHFKNKTIRLLSLMLLMLLASGASQLILPILGSGQSDLGKHIFLMNLSYDIMLGISLSWFSYLVVKFTKSLFNTNKYRNVVQQKSDAQ